MVKSNKNQTVTRGRAPQTGGMEARLTLLEQQVQSHGSQIAALAAGAGDDSQPDVAVDSRSLNFSLNPGGPAHVRVTLQYPDKSTQLVLLDDESFPSKPCPKGEWLYVTVDLIGSPGQTAVINVDNATPKQIQSTLPSNPPLTHWTDAPKPILTDW
jgi:hypothetical protein